jgi:hypothetical protein
MNAPLLDRALLRRAFTLLAENLAERSIVGEIHVFGGAAMVLAFDARAATRDVDALFEPDDHVLQAAWEVAKRLDLPRSWLNNQASSYVSGRAGRGTPVFDHPNLRVMTTPPEHLLAMKVRAARAARDTDDVRLLLRHLRLRNVADVIAIVDRYFPDEPLNERSRLLLEDVLGEANEQESR